MMNGDHNKPEIMQTIQIMKLVSMIFPAIAFFQYFFANGGVNDIITFAPSMTFALLIILGVYAIGEYLKFRLKDKIIRAYVDPTISLCLAFLSVMLTGAYTSSYKFLFLFAIIFSSIECTMRESMTITGISSIIILTIDLTLAPRNYVNPYFESDLILSCVFMIISWTIGYYVNQGNKHIEDLNNIANTDGLTGLYNHRFFYDCFTEQLETCKRNGTELSLLFIDIDDFKYYNDLYGHQKGDEVLREMAAIMRDTIRNDTFIARYGGEEFTILLPGIEESTAVRIAERLRLVVEAYDFEGQECMPGGTLTISVGVSTFPDKAKTDTELLKGADDACYRAKFLRKNRVEAYYSILEELQKDMDESGREIIASIKTLIAVINAKDKYTYRHVERVVYYCMLLADNLKMDETERKRLVYAAYLHDIGKISISEDILMKSEKLTTEEWNILKLHPQYAVEIIENVPALHDSVPVIIEHHERFDGTGYPNGLKGEDIDPMARLLTVVDSFDAMTSMRPYQHKKTYSEAVRELYGAAAPSLTRNGAGFRGAAPGDG
jgi:diguanylate cyclase (GGDEF)-like protein